MIVLMNPWERVGRLIRKRKLVKFLIQETNLDREINIAYTKSGI